VCVCVRERTREQVKERDRERHTHNSGTDKEKQESERERVRAWQSACMAERERVIAREGERKVSTSLPPADQRINLCGHVCLMQCCSLHFVNLKRFRVERDR